LREVFVVAIARAEDATDGPLDGGPEPIVERSRRVRVTPTDRSEQLAVVERGCRESRSS
jgi:hypothetical protein